MPEGEVRIRINARDDASAQMGAVTRAVKQLIGAWLGFQGVKQLMREIQDVVGGFAAYTEQIDKANKVTGIATDTLQRLAYAAEQEHASFEVVNNALKFLVRNMTSVQDGLAESKRAFDRIGISALDSEGKLRNVEDVFYEVAEAIRNAKSDTEAMSIALDLFGRSGTEIIPLTKLGAEGLKAMGDEAARMGKVLDEVTIKEGKMFADQMTRIKNEVEATKLAIARDLMPSLYEMLELVRNLTKVYDSFSNAVRFAMMRLPRNVEDMIRESILHVRELQAEFKKQVAEINQYVFGSIARWTEESRKRREAEQAWLSELITFEQYLEEIEARDVLKKTRAAWMELEASLDHINLVLPEIVHQFEGYKGSILDLVPGIEEVTLKSDEWELEQLQNFEELRSALYDYTAAFSTSVVDALYEGRMEFGKFLRDFLTGVAKMITQMMILKGLQAIFGFGFMAHGGPIPKMQSGGMIPGGPPYSDRVLFAGMPGEGVVNRLGMQTLGREGLERLNRGQTISNQVEVNIVIQGSADENTVRSMEMMLRRKLPAMIKDAERRRQI